MGCFRSRSLAAVRRLLVATTLVLASHARDRQVDARCEFDAIFNFGDSNSDTGGFYAAFPAQPSPWGMTYFGKPTGRASDGRLVIDFLARALGFPLLSPYLRALGSDFRHGANFATLASTVLLPNTSLFVTGISPFSLAIQSNQMKEFRARVAQLRFQGADAKGLPPLNVFGKSLYTFNIGQNDFTSNLAAIGIERVKQYLPDVVNEIAWTIKVLYDEGGRTFLVQNLAPIGCYPAFLVELPHGQSDLDRYGCMTSYNDAVTYYNALLKGRLDQLRPQLPRASVIYVDTHTVELELFRNPTHHGLKYGTKACCGYGGDPYNFDPRVFCGNTKVINGSTVTASACSDPQNYVSWDGIHFSEAANKAIAYAILSGAYFFPSFPIGKLCDLQPIG
ncbi:unnamed protein product [Victoria cruziana]